MTDADEADTQAIQVESDFSGFRDCMDAGDLLIAAHSHLLKKRKNADARNQEEPVCIIVRTIKKPIPFNFYNKCSN